MKRIKFSLIILVFAVICTITPVFSETGPVEKPKVMPPTPLLFLITEGLNHNYFFQSRTAAAHIMLTDGDRGRIYVNFPAQNSGVAFQADRNDPDMKGLRLSFVGQPGEFTRNKLRGVTFNVKTNKNRLVLMGPVMDNIRFIRAFDYPQGIAPLVKEKREFLQLAGMPEAGYLTPVVTSEKNRGLTLSFRQKTFDNKNNYYSEVIVPQGVTAKREGETVVLTSKQPISFGIVAAMDYSPLTPYYLAELLNGNARAYRGNLTRTNPAALKTYNEALRALLFLSYHEKYLAGSWRFLTYFGRDTMMSLMLLKDSLQHPAFEAGMQSVLNRMNNAGEVAHEEDIGDQAILRHIPEYIALRKQGKNAEAERVRRNLADPVYDYKMIDDDYMYPVMLEMYVTDPSILKTGKRSFLDRKNARNEQNIVTTARNFDYIIGQTEPYAATGDHRKLIKLKEGEHAGDWRDSETGLAHGRYPGSVNVDFVAAALVAIRNTIQADIYSKDELLGIAQKHNLKHLEKMVNEPAFFDTRIANWDQAKRHFKIHYTPDQMRERLKSYLESDAVTPDEKQYYLSRHLGGMTVQEFVYEGKTPGPLVNGLTFYALSLDANANPIEVPNSDVGFRLYNYNPDPAEIEHILTLIELPFPVGLAEQGGIMTASPVYAGNKALRKDLDKNAYHGLIVWSWQMALIEKGLEKQIRRFHGKPGYETLVNRMYDNLQALQHMEKQAGSLVNSELWTHRLVNGKMVPAAYGTESTNVTESNPVQLWSTVRIATMQSFDAVKKMLKK